METAARSDRTADISGQPGEVSSHRLVESGDLLQGSREIHIRHGNSTYKLRLTMSDKLILTK